MRVSLCLNAPKTPYSKPVYSKTPEYRHGFCAKNAAGNITTDTVNFTSSNRIERKKFPFSSYASDIRCPSCGDKMEGFDKEEAKAIAEELAPKTGKDLQNALIKNRNKFQAAKQPLVDELIKIAPRYKNKNFSGLLHVLANRKYIDTLRTKQLLVTAFLGNEILNLNPENMAKMVDWQKDQITRIMQAENEGEFRNKYLITSFINYAAGQGIEIDENSVRAYFAKLPNSRKDMDAYVVKYMRRSPKEAIYRLIKNTEPTIEHIRPFSKSRDNSMGNLLLMCSDCNSARGDMTYKDYLEDHPEMKENIKKYFEDIEGIIQRKRKSKSLSDAESTYIRKVKRTLEAYSSGELSFGKQSN